MLTEGSTLNPPAPCHVQGRYGSASALESHEMEKHGQILVDYYRAQRTEKRGGRAKHLPLERVDEVLGSIPHLTAYQEEALLALDESLVRLAAESEKHARIIECRFFGGMTIEETAHALGISTATVKRGVTVARAWLARDMDQYRIATKMSESP